MTISNDSAIRTERATILVPMGEAKDLPASLHPYLDDHSRQTIAEYARTGAGKVDRFHTSRNMVIYTIGLGADADFAGVLKAARRFAHQHDSSLPAELVLCWPTSLSDRLLEAFVNGLYLGTYRLSRLKTQDTPVHPLRSPEARLVLLEERPELTAAAERGRTVADVQMRISDLVNLPSNYKRPAELGQWALDSGQQYGYRVEVWDRARCEQEGLHALLAVNRGSEDPPAFIIMEYQGQGASQKIGLVGKGVTFDTGGVSIKPSSNMHLMKSDMGGAAAVLGTIEAAARLQLPVHLVGIIPATDNVIDARSIKPGDVIGSYSGKSIEVIDTDAEGRLILADGLAFLIRNHAPDIIIDLATLTGSTVRTLGYAAAALFTNNEALARTLYDAGQRVGEKLWRLPLWDDYKDDLKSDVADVRNFSGKPIAGAINAAKFLEVFTEEHPRWVHIDIAGVAMVSSEFGSDRGATAYGVRLLLEFMNPEQASA